ncbi:Nramp family divalent metal transporter [Dactylosporangium aurantiacum]|uniref:Nramp family divalent metal transporter n=1 Tax=Dactylosporangium aurantiacum TaxID=35754 RepID=A0A9Q9IAY8_9ACTN|nr:Nramp family divalent metal transporter [Dactylosporangium aurantiacum]MDG6101750.1 Nramp family divalent metal transporter [Dactylosporangium aurantiacum]UWZ52441.1 Nramp family divalent metal transporter [Dactylosporangium aurantiacum]
MADTARVVATERPPAGPARPARLTPMMGPAVVAAVAYVDPGDVATNLTAGATSGYRLVWVVVAAGLVAVLVQYQAAKLGMATGRSLPELCRERFPRWGRRILWLQAELVVLATDLAGFVGAAIGLRLLSGMPVAVSAAVTATVSLLLLALRRNGRARRFECATAAALLLIGAGTGYDLFAAGHQSASGFAAGLVPRLDGAGQVLLAMGIVGATVMPHAVYLHSALTGPGARPVGPLAAEPRDVRRALRLDCGIALSAAAVVNVSMIALGAGLAALTGGTWTGDLFDAHTVLAERAGGVAALAFAVALLSSGFASSGVGTLAGDVVMAGFLGRGVPVYLRRLVTMAPSVVLLTAGTSLTTLLVASQVVISLGVPVALFLLIHCCRDRALMGPLVNARVTTTVAAGAASAVAAAGLALPMLLLA